MLKYLLTFVLIIILYRMIKSALIVARKNNPVKGQTKDDQSIQQKHKNKIEDADFEEIE